MILGLCGKRVSALFRGDIECDHGLSLANVRYFKSWRPVIWLQARRNLILAVIRTSRAKHAVHFGLFLGSDQRERHQKTHRITMQGDLRG